MRIRPYFTFAVWCVLWVAQWWLVPLYFIRTQALGYYPPEADSIGIPVFGMYMMVIFIGPFLALLLWHAARQPDPRFLTWTVWCRERWGRSLLWTIIFGFMAYSTVGTFVTNVSIGLPQCAIADAWWFYVHLAFRAIFVARLKTEIEQERADWNLVREARIAEASTAEDPGKTLPLPERS